MVRSMMNLTTLPLSFWDYALETATRILNMVPTKKGCEALVKRDTPDKLQQRSIKCIFIGYPKETMGYYFYFLPENKIIVARYAEFLEKNILSQEISRRAKELKETQDKDTSPSENTSNIPMEVEGFEPPQEEVIPIRRVNYEETFSPVADIRAIRILIAIAMFYYYEIWHMDVKTAFLNGYLDEDIYMVQPEGKAAFILRIKIYRDRSKRLIRLSQSAYMDKILKRYRMDNSKRGNIPMQEKLDLNKTQGASTPEEVKRMQNVPYASAIGSIMYAVRCTRPDVANTKDTFLVFGGNPKAELRVDCYCDAGFETNRDDTKSQTGYVFILNGGLGIVPTINEPVKMFCDNSAALHFANEPGVQKGARHYHRRYHYVRECIELGKIKLLKVHIDDNLAYPFTKALSKGKLTQHARSMGLRLASSFIDVKVKEERKDVKAKEEIRDVKVEERKDVKAKEETAWQQKN
ncbi:retrotransposon protein, putative, ty1-copia subclass [Tanacetum coccineum]